MNYSDFTNMSAGFTKVSKGYAMVSGRRFYCELWLAASTLCIQTRIFLDKPYTVSHLCDTWHNAGKYIFTYVRASTGGQWVRSANDYVDRVIEDTKLQIFEESRKWLTKEEKSSAEMLALGCISIEDVEYVLKCDVCDLPQAFHDYVKQYGAEYDAYIARKQKEECEMFKNLNTPKGLAYMLRQAERHGIHQPAVSFIKELIFDLTELWGK